MHTLEHLLQSELQPIARRYREHRLSRRLAYAWAIAGLVAILLLLTMIWTGWRWPWLVPLLALTAVALIAWLRRRWQRDTIETAWIVRNIEQEHPRLHALLLTAVEQHPDAKTGELHYLQQRVIEDALSYNRLHPWGHRSYEHLFFAQCAHRGAQVLFAFALVGLYLLAPLRPAPSPLPTPTLTVTPGDTSIERGENLVVLARFPQEIPSEVTLVVTSADGIQSRIPLVRNLEDPVFGGSVPALTNDILYHVAFGDAQSEDYRVTVFDYPRLDRADARLIYPEYTGLEPRTLDDTRRITAVEGTRLEYTLLFNKPITTALWTTPNNPPLPLEPDPDRPQVQRLSITLDESRRYGLTAFDEAGRSNRVTADFVVEVFTNRPPDLQLISPRGDDRASPLEEIVFRGQASDDFGVRSAGIAYRLTGDETRFIELGGPADPHEKLQFQKLLALEDLEATSGQLLTYFLWADDIGPDGTSRRTFSDLFFIEVRPFEEIFRQGQSADGQGGGGGEQPETPGQQLAELQKQIISATWTLQRQSASRIPDRFTADAEIIRQSQDHALEQASELAMESNDPNSSIFLEAAQNEMRRAVQHLDGAARQASADPLSSALDAEQSAYEALLQLQAREFQVARGQPGGGGGGGATGRAQRQLDQLQLKDAENRYQTQSQATAPPTEQQRQQLEFLVRLRELAQRQQDINQQLQELELALQEARTPEERDELLRRLKRLQEEQRQMLADVDELQQRMEQPGSQAQTAEARQQLDQARSNLQQAADAIQQGAVSDAVASGTRASRQMEQLRDELRNESSSQFTDDMRRMRDNARQLVERQQSLAQDLNALAESSRPTLSNSQEREDLADRMAEQTADFNELLDQLRHTSEQSELSEPILSRQLHETFRDVRQADAATPRQLLQDLMQQGVLTRPVLDLLHSPEATDLGQSLHLNERFLRDGHLTAAQHLEPRIRNNLEQLSRAIDQAAQSIIGDDTQALRLARAELDELLSDLEREISQAQGSSAQSTQPNQPGQPGQSGQSNQSDQSDQSDPDSPGDGRGQNRPMFYELAAGPETGGGGGGGTTGPLTGGGYRQWADRLAQVEELIELPDLRTDVGRVRDRARVTRSEFTRNGQAPQWDLVRIEMANPLADIRQRLNQELARRQSADALVPIDRDPVPRRYTELVRRYYERLGDEE
jgi:hypothetical protein